MMEFGGLIVSGYRPALVKRDTDSSMSQKLMLVPLFSMAYDIQDKLALTYTNIAGGIGIMGLEVKY